jgi:hypothetical protein
MAIIQKPAVTVATPTPEAVQVIENLKYNPPAKAVTQLTKFQFRQLFTFEERVKIDNLQYSDKVPGAVKAAVFTFQKDMELSSVVELGSPAVTAGIMFLNQIGLLTIKRADRILANLRP